VVLRHRAVGEENGWAIETGSHDVHTPITVKIGECGAAESTLRAKLLRREYSVRGLMKKEAALLRMMVGE
jgi:hypothetical protein